MRTPEKNYCDRCGIQMGFIPEFELHQKTDTRKMFSFGSGSIDTKTVGEYCEECGYKIKAFGNIRRS